MISSSQDILVHTTVQRQEQEVTATVSEFEYFNSRSQSRSPMWIVKVKLQDRARCLNDT
jgi:hypothetical protein